MSMLKYIELKSGYSDDGPAWIGHVQISRAGRTLYFNGKAFKRCGRGSGGNHRDPQTGERYWISNVKKDGSDRHWAGTGKITIEAAAVDEIVVCSVLVSLTDLVHHFHRDRTYRSHNFS